MARLGDRTVTVLGLALLVGAGLGCASNGSPRTFSMSQEPIIGGTVDSTHTSVVALVYMGQQFCTGSLIAPQWVLSAGHCLKEQGAPPCCNNTEVFFGTTVGSGGTSIPVSEVHVPSNWSTDAQGTPHYDVSLWKLATPSSAAVMPWQSTPLADPTNKTVTFIGYGVTDANTQDGNGTRRQVDGVITSIDSDFLYYGNGISGTCQGDSGGPTLLNGVVIAVTSAGDQSCVQFGENTRTDANAAFIQQYVGTTTTVQPVTVAITAPATGATESPDFTVTASLASTAGIYKAQLYVDGTLTQELPAAPWSFKLLNVATGSRTIMVKGLGSDGGTGQASVTVTVVPGCGVGPACASGYTCVNGSCTKNAAGCGSGPACESGYSCVGGACVPSLSAGTCSASSPCPSGYDCISGECLISGAPAAGTTGASCQFNTDCDSGICIDGTTGNGYCSQVCVTASDCPHRADCIAVAGAGNLCGAPNSAAGSGNTLSSSGCAAGGPAGPAGALGLLVIALAIVLRRRSG